MAQIYLVIFMLDLGFEVVSPSSRFLWSLTSQRPPCKTCDLPRATQWDFEGKRDLNLDLWFFYPEVFPLDLIVPNFPPTILSPIINIKKSWKHVRRKENKLPPLLLIHVLSLGGDQKEGLHNSCSVSPPPPLPHNTPLNLPSDFHSEGHALKDLTGWKNI